MSPAYDHAARLDASVAIVGAGLAGLACARRLQAAGAGVVVHEKSRGPSGRCSTRRDESGAAHDHGAQYYTVREAAFRAEHERWSAAGVVARWEGRIGAWDGGRIEPKDGGPERHVGVPGMNAIGRHLAQGVHVRLEAQVAAIEGAPGRWSLRCADGVLHGPWSAVVVTAPAAQAASLVAPHDAQLAATAAALEAHPCWALMLEADGELLAGFDGVFVNGHGLGWLAREASKPGRAPGARWTVHAAPAWSREHLELGAREAALALQELCAQWLSVVDGPAAAAGVRRAKRAVAHRWRYSIPVAPRAERSAASACGTLLLAGDAHGGPRIEGAWSSGLAAAERILAVKAI